VDQHWASAAIEISSKGFPVQLAGLLLSSLYFGSIVMDSTLSRQGSRDPKDSVSRRMKCAAPGRASGVTADGDIILEDFR